MPESWINTTCNIHQLLDIWCSPKTKYCIQGVLHSQSAASAHYWVSPTRSQSLTFPCTRWYPVLYILPTMSYLMNTISAPSVPPSQIYLPQFNYLPIDRLQIDHLQMDHFEMDHLQMHHLQMHHRQMHHLQIDTSNSTTSRSTTSRFSKYGLTTFRLITARLTPNRLATSRLPTSGWAASKYFFNFYRIWHPGDSHNSLLHSLQVCLIRTSKYISNHLHYCLLVDLWDFMILASKWISKFVYFRPPYITLCLHSDILVNWWSYGGIQGEFMR